MLSGVVVMSTLDQAMNYLADVAQGYTWGSSKNLTLSRYNCSGTINGGFSYRIRSDNKAIKIGGRVYISSFSRTGANPGVTFADIGVTSSQGYPVGYRGESPAETVNLSFVNHRINTNETFTNASGTRLTLMIPDTIILL